jgi:hypothetical protein
VPPNGSRPWRRRTWLPEDQRVTAGTAQRLPPSGTPVSPGHKPEAAQSPSAEMTARGALSAPRPRQVHPLTTAAVGRIRHLSTEGCTSQILDARQNQPPVWQSRVPHGSEARLRTNYGPRRPNSAHINGQPRTPASSGSHSDNRICPIWGSRGRESKSRQPDEVKVLVRCQICQSK